MELKKLLSHLYCEEENFYGALNYLIQRHATWSSITKDEAEEKFIGLIANAIGDPITERIKEISGSGQLEMVHKGIFMVIDNIPPPSFTEDVPFIRFYQTCG